MASETQRAARALVERRTERFESRHDLEVSRRRLEDTLSRARPGGRVVFTPEWQSDQGKVILQATFAPPPRVGLFLTSTSVVMTLLVAATTWALVAEDAGTATAWLLALLTGFTILALPLVYVGMGSARMAEETRITRAIRAALLDEEEKLPPAKKWEDEE